MYIFIYTHTAMGSHSSRVCRDAVRSCEAAGTDLSEAGDLGIDPLPAAPEEVRPRACSLSGSYCEDSDADLKVRVPGVSEGLCGGSGHHSGRSQQNADVRQIALGN